MIVAGVVAWVLLVYWLVTFGEQTVDLERACFELEQMGHECL